MANSAEIGTRQWTQINRTNVSRMGVKWVFAVPNSGRLQGTPQVHDGVMYVTNTNTVIALDAGSGARFGSIRDRRQRG